MSSFVSRLHRGHWYGWIFWGVAAPWIAANLFTFWFCAHYMVDDDLGEEES